MGARWAPRSFYIILVFLSLTTFKFDVASISVEELTIAEIQEALQAGELSSVQLVEAYLRRIRELNPLLRAVIELNPDALQQAERADRQRRRFKKKGWSRHIIGGLQGIPVLLKDNIATRDKLNTTAGSYALLGSKVPKDASVVARLRRAGAIILGKANLSEWANFRSSNPSNGWSARGGQTKNPYVLSADPSGSSTGSAVAVAANLVAVALGTETDGSILSPASNNAVVGIKPSVGLTSRAGVVPISHHQDTVGPLCRSVADAVEVLDVIAGRDELDNATWRSATLIPKQGYKQFLKSDGLHGKRLGVVPELLSPSEAQAIAKHLQTMRDLGSIVVDNVTIPTLDSILRGTNEQLVLLYDFKQDLNSYLAQLEESPAAVRSLADVIQFNTKHATLEELNVFDQALFLASEATTGFQSREYKDALRADRLLTKYGIDKAMKELKLDAVLAGSNITSVAAIAGYPGISVPAGYDKDGVPFGVIFVGKKGSEPTLIEIAYAFERATHVRKPPSFLP